MFGLRMKTYILLRVLIYPFTSSGAVATLSSILHHSLELIAVASNAEQVSEKLPYGVGGPCIR